jgi:hypothetical protein
MLVEAQFLDNEYTQSELDQIFNDLLLDVQGFAKFTCMDGRTFGVSSLCDTCEIDLPWCVRKSMYDQLISAQILAERKLGYHITPRYHEKKIEWDGVSKIQLKAGLAAFHVSESITDVEDYDSDTFPVSPYVTTTTVLASSYVEVSTIYGPPSSLIFRDEDHNLINLDDSVRVTRVDGKWRIRLESMEEDDEVNVQS